MTIPVTDLLDLRDALLLHDGAQDVRRGHLRQFKQWYSALSKREYEPATVVFHGDSVTNGFGATAKNLTFTQLFRDGIQRMYRSGGVGYIPVTANNTPWVLANGEVDGGASDPVATFGIGRKSYWMNAVTETATYTFTGDRIVLYFSALNFTGTASMVIDGGANQTLNTFSATQNVVKWDSGPLTPTISGTHTIVVKPNAAATLIILHGGHVYNTDFGKGVHVVEAGHDGFHAGHYNDQAVTTGAIDHYIAMQTHLVRPDLVFIQFGLNEQGSSVPASTLETNLHEILDNYRAQCVPAPSFALMSIWARGDSSFTDSGWQPYREAMRRVALSEDAAFFDLYDLGGWMGDEENAAFSDVVLNSTINITSATAQFRAHDIGKVVAGTGIPNGTTIATTPTPTTATLSAAATQSITTTMVIFARKDPQQLTTDLLHASDRGNQWIADELQRLVAGQPKNLAIPQGLADAKGDIPVATAADTFGKLELGTEGQALHVATGSSLGVAWGDPGMFSRIIQVLANPGAATFTNVGLAAAPTVTSPTAAASDDQADGPHVRINTATTLNSDASIVTPFTICRSAWIPEFTTAVRTHTTLANIRIWAGLFSGTPVAAADPALVGAAFRYDTSVDGTAFWRCWTNDGTTTGLATTTTVGIATSSKYRLRIEFRGTVGVNATAVWFYINDVNVARHTTELPGGSTNNLGVHVGARNIAAGTAKSLLVSRFSISYA